MSKKWHTALTSGGSIMLDELLGVGLYTPVEAQRLLGIPASKIRRWLKGHGIGNRSYPALWHPQIDLGDDSLYLGFRDLMELRTAHQFIVAGVSAQRIRRAIIEARKHVDDERPLSTTRFRTDGRTIFLEIASEEHDAKLLDLFSRQYAFSRIIDRSLKDVEFDGLSPARWWIGSEESGIVIDPGRAFGQPIDNETGVPTATLAHAAKAEGSTRAAARAWQVPEVTVRRAVKFENGLADMAA
jgi:uncharacterized protein (DUF433 family)